MFAAGMNWAALLGTIGVAVTALLAVAGLVGVLWSVGRVKGMEGTIDLIRTGNDELRDQLITSRSDLDRERRECSTRIANLEGQLTTLTGGLAEKIIKAVVTGIMQSEWRPSKE